VVLGLGTGRPDDEVIAFAFEEAGRRSTTPKIVHGWNLPRHYAYDLPGDPGLHAEVGRKEAAAPAEVLRPWRQKGPDVEVAEVSRCGSPANEVIDASRGASLVVIGRRIRGSPIGAHTEPSRLRCGTTPPHRRRRRARANDPGGAEIMGTSVERALVDPVVVGVDGSEPSLRAADWAADEAVPRGVPLRVVYASLRERHEGPRSPGMRASSPSR
jgi:hypothetical protein